MEFKTQSYSGGFEQGLPFIRPLPRCLPDIVNEIRFCIQVSLKVQYTDFYQFPACCFQRNPAFEGTSDVSLYFLFYHLSEGNESSGDLRY